jgi:hypothetical protein
MAMTLPFTHLRLSKSIILAHIFLFISSCIVSCKNNETIQEEHKDVIIINNSDSSNTYQKEESVKEFVFSTYSHSNNIVAKDYSALDSLIPNFTHSIVKCIIIKVNMYREIFSQDSIKETYEIKLKSNNLSFENTFGKHRDKYECILNGKKMIPKLIFFEKEFILDSLRLQIDYTQSEYYKITNADDYLLIISKSNQWTGNMSSHSYYQIIDSKNEIITEFIY